MGGGGQQPSTSVQQTTQTSEPPSYIRPYLKKGIQDLTALYDKGSAPAYYPGATVAPLSANTQAALGALYERGARGSPVVGAANRGALDTLGGKYLDIAGNPYFQKALAAGFRPQNEQFTAEVLPSLDARFAGAGRYGMGAYRDTTLRAVDSLARAQADAAAKASGDAYAAERGHQAAAMGLAPQLAAQDYIDIEAMGRAGQARDRQRQAEIDSDIARYNYDANKDWNYINRYLASLNAGYPGGETNGTVRGSAMPASKAGPDWLTAMLGIGDLGLRTVGLFSDERLKQDVEPVGALNDGQTVYRYRYRGDPRTRIGLLAQEVERVRPGAVARHPSGYRMVDYGRATARAAAARTPAAIPAGGLL
jgi:hypothetical protein